LGHFLSSLKKNEQNFYGRTRHVKSVFIFQKIGLPHGGTSIGTLKDLGLVDELLALVAEPELVQVFEVDVRFAFLILSFIWTGNLKKITPNTIKKSKTF
jgi:hypothetical protein